LKTDFLAEGDPEFLGDAFGHGSGGQPTGLGATDAPAFGPPRQFQGDLGKLGGFARAGIPADDDHRVTADRVPDLVPTPRDGQLLWIGDFQTASWRKAEWNSSGSGLAPGGDAPMLSRSMRIKSANFVKSGRSLEDCPEWEFPEFCFIGRSNVGKSSLVNLLCNRNSLAAISGTPGKTRQLNFYLINDAWSLVDLPGYGYAKTAKTEKYDFNELAADYIEQRRNLRHVFVLIDSRLDPQKIDLNFLGWLGGTTLPYSLIFTKTDKQSPTRTRTNAGVFLEALTPLVPVVPEILTSSAKDRSGRDEILGAIGRYLEPTS
jgi:GTP-binding protein